VRFTLYTSDGRIRISRKPIGNGGIYSHEWAKNILYLWPKFSNKPGRKLPYFLKVTIL